MIQSNLLGFLGIMNRANALRHGAFQVEVGMKKGEIRLLLVAEDASDRTKKDYDNAAFYHKIPILFFGTKQELGSVVGKTERACLGLTEEGFTKAFLKKLNNTQTDEVENRRIENGTKR